MMMAYKPLKSVSGMNSGIQLGLGATERYFETIDQKPKMKNKKSAKEINMIKGKIEFKDVYFNYIEEKSALNGLNLNIESGKVVALVGPSGGGKSTIMNMILRFYDPKKVRLPLMNII